MTFQDFGLADHVLRGVQAAGYTTPTPIQAAAIPVARSGRDMIGCAQTGTGKTAAFVLPLLHRLAEAPSARGRRRVRGLVVAPTRELALQVETAVRTYGRSMSCYSLAVFGGVPIGPQIKQLRRGVDLIVATPGRLLDLMERGHADLSAVEVLVLDEADRMLDMGFIHDIRKIVAATPRERQTMLFSATMPKAVGNLARSIMARNAAFVQVGERRNPAETVAQHACAVSKHQKMDLLLHVLDNEPIENVLVFSRTKHRADRITKRLSKRGFSATALHSNKSQNQRQRALKGFRQGRYQILVATDIAARGIDVDTISHVINYDTPNQAEDYIHRIGRTGRAQSSGDAITFVDHDEADYLRNIEQHTGQRLARKVYDGFDTGRTETESDGGDGAPRPSRDGGPRRGQGGPAKRDYRHGNRRRKTSRRK